MVDAARPPCTGSPAVWGATPLPMPFTPPTAHPSSCRCLHVEDAFARDVRPGSLGAVAGSLGDWLGAASAVLAGIEQRIDWTSNAAAAAERQRDEAAKALEGERKSIRTTIELQVG